MRIQMNQRVKGIGILLLCGLAAGFLSGCNDDRFDHHSPAGQGSLVVDNWTGDRMTVYVDGLEVGSTDGGKYSYYDLEPGLHRAVLDADDSDRAWAGDVDILEGRLTVLEVSGYGADYRDFIVRIYFE